MTTKQLAIKLDVDTLQGYLKGVPRLLDVFRKRELRASIFFSMGPDNSGRAIRRIFRKGFISKMVRTSAPSTYGLRTLLYGTLLPAPMVVEREPEILKRASAEHDCGVHAWDHVYIQDNLDRMNPPEVAEEYRKAFELFESVTGRPARSSAAPGWQTNGFCFAVEDQLKLDYASDCRGETPFYPELGEVVYHTLQIPTTLPTLDEISPKKRQATADEFWMSLLQKETEVLTIHAEMEGGAYCPVFERFLDRVADKGIALVTLDEVASSYRDRARVHGVTRAPLPGRSGLVVTQAPYKDDKDPPIPGRPRRFFTETD